MSEKIEGYCIIFSPEQIPYLEPCVVEHGNVPGVFVKRVQGLTTATHTLGETVFFDEVNALDRLFERLQELRLRHQQAAARLAQVIELTEEEIKRVQEECRFNAKRG